MIKVTATPGEELVEVIAKKVNELDIRNAAITSVIGAVDSCGITNMPQNNAREDVLTEYSAPCELSGTGEVQDGVVHIHCVLTREGDAAIGGHLIWARVDTHFVNVYLTPLD